MKQITIEPVSRIEGHAKVTIQLDDAGKVTDTRFHVTQVRGFEKFTEGRPFYEMPGITSRICGICPISHQLASAKACDAILAVCISRTARLLREIIHLGQVVQSHALSFFYLSAPDLLLGMDCDPARRNVFGVIEANPELARAGIELRKFGLQVIEGLAGERVHPSWIVPGGVRSPMTAQARNRFLVAIPEAMATTEKTLAVLKGVLDSFTEEIANFGSAPTMYAGLVDTNGKLQLYDGVLRFRAADGSIVHGGVAAENYRDFVGEVTLNDSYLKAPFYKPQGWPEGIYRVGALARINVAEAMGTPRADAELQEFRQRFGRMAHSSFLYHYARLIEVIYALENLDSLLREPDVLDTRVRAEAEVNSRQGIGVIEAPRGTLIHDYKVDDHGAIIWANLIVATGHNNSAISNGIRQVAEHFINGDKLQEGMLNRVSALVRAYDPCLSCATHAVGEPALDISLLNAKGALLDRLRTE